MKPSPGELARREQALLSAEAAKPIIAELLETECERLVRLLVADKTPTYEQLLDIRAGFCYLRKQAMALDLRVDMLKQLARGGL